MVHDVPGDHRVEAVVRERQIVERAQAIVDADPGNRRVLARVGKPRFTRVDADALEPFGSQIVRVPSNPTPEVEHARQAPLPQARCQRQHQWLGLEPGCARSRVLPALIPLLMRRGKVLRRF